mgnify:FL=1
MKLAYFSIDHLNSTSEPPPRELLKFCYWCLRGSHIAIGLAAVASILSGIAETLTAALMGFILDLIIKAEPTTLLSENFFILGFVFVFLLGVRPFFFAFSAYLQSVVLGPGLRTLVASRLHRWTLGHSKTFFEMISLGA